MPIIWTREDCKKKENPVEKPEEPKEEKQEVKDNE